MDLTEIDARITSAWHALAGARATCWHSPNAESCKVEAMAERTVNELLEARHEMTTKAAV